jgi:hypothetical protein
MTPDVSPGDIVEIDDVEVITMDGDPMRRLRKATSPYARGIVGVVSDPAKATDFNVIGYNIREEDHPMPLALNGRLMVTVSTENGPIAPGDPITASTMPGVGMKATEPGMIVGFAINEYSELAPGRVMVMINPGWWDDDATENPPFREGPLTAILTTAADGEMQVYFPVAVRAEPVVALTVKGEHLAFAQVSNFIKGRDGTHVGMKVKTFAPSGAALGRVTVHYVVHLK